jgi:hypothetical protein
MKKKIILKNNLRSWLMPLMLLSLLAMGSCEKCDDPCNIDCENYDPCCGQSRADASFKIYELLKQMPIEDHLGFEGEDVATDTIIATNFALFKADHEAEYYEWRVGNDPRVWNDREFKLRFSTIPFYTPVEVQLKVYKKTDQSCFPNVSDTAVFTRTLVTVPLDSSLMIGHFKGYLDSSPNDANFFELRPEMSQTGFESFNISGINPKCSINLRDTPTSHAIGYRSLYFNSRGVGPGCCLGLSGYGVLVSESQLVMHLGMFPADPVDSCDFSLLNDPYENDKFIGKKI